MPYINFLKARDGKNKKPKKRFMGLKLSQKVQFVTAKGASSSDLDTSKDECEGIDSFLMHSGRS